MCYECFQVFKAVKILISKLIYIVSQTLITGQDVVREHADKEGSAG
jgi:hypothetical protein